MTGDKSYRKKTFAAMTRVHTHSPLITVVYQDVMASAAGNVSLQACVLHDALQCALMQNDFASACKYYEQTVKAMESEYGAH